MVDCISVDDGTKLYKDGIWNSELFCNEVCCRASCILPDVTVWSCINILHSVSKLRRAGDSGSVSFCPNYSVRRIFTDSQESLTADYLLEAAELHHGLSSRAVRLLAFDFATVNHISIPSSWILNQGATEDWLLAFMKRHWELSLRTPEPTSLSRATSFNRANVGKYFDNLDMVLALIRCIMSTKLELRQCTICLLARHIEFHCAPQKNVPLCPSTYNISQIKSNHHEKL